MKTVVILGAGQAGRAAAGLLNPNHMEVVAFGDNNPATWTEDQEISVLPVADALKTSPDLVLLGVLDSERSDQFRDQLTQLGYQGECMSFSELYSAFDVRSATLRRVAARLEESGVQGAVAELGVYRGDLAWQINDLFPNRKLYLFDTFDGFDDRDIQAERAVAASKAQPGDFSNTTSEDVLARMPHQAQIVIKKGRFPDTAQGLEERFALVSIDVDLYAPTLAGLEYFYPRLSGGGVILLHDYNSSQFDGVKKAVRDYEQAHGRLPMIPLSDLHGTAVIIRGDNMIRGSKQ